MPLDLSRQLVARWPDASPAHLPLLKQAGIEAVILDAPNPAFTEAAQQAGIATATASALTSTVTAGALWPGVRTPAKSRDWVEETASASNEPWLDANLWLVHYHRALHPNSVPVLAYQPNQEAGLDKDRYVPFETLELALIEARLGGGNYILALEPRYREALLKADAKATAAWNQLAQTARWLSDNRRFFGLPVRPTITMVVDSSDATQEIALLAFRRGASPALVSPERLPPPQPNRILALAAASLQNPSPDFQQRLFAHAATAGAFVVTDWKPAHRNGWKEIRKQEDRTFYQLGKGQVVEYHETIVDPSEFALDVMDLITYRKRPARLWNALAAIAVATEGPAPGELVLQVVNYGQPTRDEVQARVLGHYAKATVSAPNRQPQPLRTYRRGEMTEVFLPRLEHTSFVHFHA
jgi:hypothetical protein